MAVAFSASASSGESMDADRENRTGTVSEGCGSLARFFLRIGAMVMNRYRR